LRVWILYRTAARRATGRLIEDFAVATDQVDHGALVDRYGGLVQSGRVEITRAINF